MWLLIFFACAGMVVILCAIWMIQENTIRVSNSPNERYSLSVIRRNLDSLPVMPGQGSDVKCFVELRKKENGQLILRKSVDMLQNIEQIQWGDGEVWINPHWAISYEGTVIGNWQESCGGQTPRNP
jgi:hypothetical protein